MVLISKSQKNKGICLILLLIPIDNNAILKTLKGKISAKSNLVTY